MADVINNTVAAVNNTIINNGQSFSQILDKILSVVIPIIVFAMFGFMIYKAFQEPLDKLFAWIGDKWKESTTPKEETTHQQRFSGLTLDPNSRAELYK
jgi:hypothetical protein